MRFSTGVLRTAFSSGRDAVCVFDELHRDGDEGTGASMVTFLIPVLVTVIQSYQVFGLKERLSPRGRAAARFL